MIDFCCPGYITFSRRIIANDEFEGLLTEVIVRLCIKVVLHCHPEKTGRNADIPQEILLLDRESNLILLEYEAEIIITQLLKFDLILQLFY